MSDTPAEPDLPGIDAGSDAVEQDLLADIALEDADGDAAADEQLSIVDEAGEGDLADETEE